MRCPRGGCVKEAPLWLCGIEAQSRSDVRKGLCDSIEWVVGGHRVGSDTTEWVM